MGGSPRRDPASEQDGEPAPPPLSPRQVASVVAGVLLLVGALWLTWVYFPYPYMGGDRQVPRSVPVSEVAQQARAGLVGRIVAEGDLLRVELLDGTRAQARKERELSVPETLRQYEVAPEQIATIVVEVRPTDDWSWLLNILWLAPFMLLLWFWLRAPTGAAGGDAGGVAGFLRSRARRVAADHPKVHFEDVAGVDEAKQELTEIVEFLQQPERFAAVGARIPRGVLIVGPPGTGKTLLARAVAGEAGVPFFSINASEFIELFVGVGASRVRDLFQLARAQAPAIVFIDEIDAIGRRRGASFTQSHEEREQTLNQILAELDGFDPRTNVIVMAATNRPDILDPALLRPGRFDRRVTVENPDREGRLAILQVHARGKPLAADVNLVEVAKATMGFSGADLENLLNEGALLAARRGKSVIGREELEEAGDRVMAGPRRRGRGLGAAERQLVAYHEAGHALVAQRLAHADPAQRVSIVARGAAGGHTQLLPEDDRRFWARSQLADTLACALGGMAAEELVFGEPTTGPGSDLEHASALARRMVLEYGMSDRLGPVAMGHAEEGEALLGFESRPYSDETQTTIDHEVQRLIRGAFRVAHDTLERELPALKRLADALLEHETLHREELDALLGAAAGPARLAPRV